MNIASVHNSLNTHDVREVEVYLYKLNAFSIDLHHLNH